MVAVAVTSGASSKSSESWTLSCGRENCTPPSIASARVMYTPTLPCTPKAASIEASLVN